MAENASIAVESEPAVESSGEDVYVLGDRVYDLKTRIEKRIGQDIRDDVARSESFQGPVFKDMKRWGELYRGVLKRQSGEGLANVNIPVTLENIESVTANLMSLLFPTEVWLNTIPGEGATEDVARTAKAIVLSHLRMCRFQRAFRKGLSQSVLLKGSGLFKRSWHEDIRRVMVRVGTDRIEVREKVMADHAVIEPVDLMALLISHLEIETLEGQDYLIERKVISRQWLRERMMIMDDTGAWLRGRYFNSEEWEKAAFSDIAPVQDYQVVGNHLTTSSAAGHVGGDGGMGEGVGESSVRDDKIWKYEWWGVPRDDRWWPEFAQDPVARGEIMRLWGIDPEDPWVEAAREWQIENLGDDSGPVIRIFPNYDPSNALPYTKIDCIPVDNQFYAMGLAEIGESLHLMANAMANQSLDEKTKALEGMWAIQASGIDAKRMGQRLATALRWRPNGVVWTKRPVQDVIQPLVPANMSQIGDEAVGMVSEHARRATGAVDVMQAQPGERGKTATEARILTTFAHTRLGVYFDYIVETVFDHMLPLYYAMIRVLATRRQMIVILGEDGTRQTEVFDPSTLIGDVLFQFAGTRPDREAEIYRQQFTNYVVNVSGNPMLAQHANFAYLSKELARVHQVRNPDQAVIDPLRQIMTETTPLEENEALAAGTGVEVKITDELEEHILTHLQGLDMAMQMNDPVAVAAFRDHIEMHQRVLKFMLRAGPAAQMITAQGFSGNMAGDVGDDDGPTTIPDQERSNLQQGQINPNENSGGGGGQSAKPRA